MKYCYIRGSMDGMDLPIIFSLYQTLNLSNKSKIIVDSLKKRLNEVSK